MKNPKWERDELLIVLDLYLKLPKNQHTSENKKVQETSELLKNLNIKLGGNPESKFRNPNGVSMKMANFRAFDGSIQGVGLRRGGKEDRIVWDLYSNKKEELSIIVNGIKDLVNLDIELPPSIDESEDEDSEEGKLKTRFHKIRERDRKKVKKKKNEFLKKHGKLICEVCNFDFKIEYGSRGDGFIECHHTKFLSDYDEPKKTKISDLILLCSNCHRMIHRKKPWLTIDELIKIKNK
tara:strand:- start:659 stop:1369 length:711 start_codon:yes stop_codon:yes gene_type:complete